MNSWGDWGRANPFATADAAGQHVIAGAFRGGACEHRGFHLNEALALEKAAGRLDRLGPHPQVVVHALAAQIEIAVAQPQLFAGVLLVVHRHGEGQIALHAVQHGDAAGQHFYGPRGQLVVQGFRWSGPHLAVHLQHGFAAQVFRNGKSLSSEVRVHCDLDGAAAIAQIDEDHPAVVSTPVHPAAELHSVVDVLLAQVAATVAAHGVSQMVTGEFPIAQARLRPVDRRAV